MKETVVSLRDPLSDGVMRQVTVVANGNVVMTALLPRIHVVLHDVTVDAGLGIIAEVAGPFSVPESERADTREQSKRHGEKNCTHAKAGV